MAEEDLVKKDDTEETPLIEEEGGKKSKKSEDKDQYLQDIQNQINEKKKAKELEKLRDREEEILFDEKVRRDNEEL